MMFQCMSGSPPSPTHGILWSTVAKVQSVRRTGRPADRLGSDKAVDPIPGLNGLTGLQTLEGLLLRVLDD